MLSHKDYSKKLLEYSRANLTGHDKQLLDEMSLAYTKNNFEKIDEILMQMQPDYKLLENLISKLKGKSVYSNLKRLIEGKDLSLKQAIVSTSSLLTHCALEIDENKEYTKLLPDLHKKLGVLINQIGA